MVEWLARWWSKKYKLPSNHELFEARTILEHVVDFYQDYYEENPLESYRNKDGVVVFSNTGDALIDKWEAAIAEGKDIDLSEAFTDEQRADLKAKLAKAASSRKNTLGYAHAQANKQRAEIQKELGPDPSKPHSLGLFGGKS